MFGALQGHWEHMLGMLQLSDVQLLQASVLHDIVASQQRSVAAHRCELIRELNNKLARELEHETQEGGARQAGSDSPPATSLAELSRRFGRDCVNRQEALCDKLNANLEADR
jgi:hypothetical protein